MGRGGGDTRSVLQLAYPFFLFFYYELKTLRESERESTGAFSRHPEKKQEGAATSFKDTDSDELDLPLLCGLPPPSIPKTTKFHFTENLNLSLLTS